MSDFVIYTCRFRSNLAGYRGLMVEPCIHLSKMCDQGLRIATYN